LDVFKLVSNDTKGYLNSDDNQAIDGNLSTCYRSKNHNNSWAIVLKENIPIKSIRLSVSRNYTNPDYTLWIRSDGKWQIFPKSDKFIDFKNRIFANIYKSNEIISSNSIQIDSDFEFVLC
jgi:hypothetical protein